MAADQSRHTPVYTIGKVEELTGLSARQIRYYESRGLINPERSAGNQRLYTPAEVDLLRRIRGYVEQGMNVAGIKRLLEDSGELQTRPAETTEGQTADRASEPEEHQEADIDPRFDEYPARHLLTRAALRSIYPLSHPEELLKRVVKDKKDHE